MEHNNPQKIANLLVWKMGLDEARDHLHSLPDEIKSGVLAELNVAASVISRIEKKFYSERGVPLALHANVDP